MVEVFSSLEKGRGLRAKTEFVSGSEVLSCDPFIYVLSKSQKGVRCDQCLKRQKTLLRCSGCKYMRYCDKQCQRNAWQQHKTECAALKRVSPKIPPDFVILLWRVLWKLENTSDNEGTDDLVAIVDLESNYDRLSEQQKEVLGSFVVVLHSYWGKRSLPSQIRNAKALLELCAKIKNNSFAISDEELASDVGTGIYLSCSLLNHSCSPNCVAEFDEMRLNIRALQDINQGEEPHQVLSESDLDAQCRYLHSSPFTSTLVQLLISYVDLFAPSSDRQENLNDVYRFRCKCTLCSTTRHDDEMLQDVDGKMTESKRQSVKNFLHDLHNLRDTSSYGEMLQLCEGYIQRKVLPIENVYMAKVLDFAMDAGIVQGKLDNAFHYGALALPAYRKYLHERHPSTGLQLMKLAKILFHSTKDEEALNMMLEAWQVLEVTHREKGAVLSELRLMIDQCQVEIRQKEVASHSP